MSALTPAAPPAHSYDFSVARMERVYIGISGLIGAGMSYSCEIFTYICTPPLDLILLACRISNERSLPSHTLRLPPHPHLHLHPPQANQL